MASADRSWMYVDRRARRQPPFFEGLQGFLNFAWETNTRGKIRCPCVHCKNSKWKDPMDVAEHVQKAGFVNGYNLWYAHGENFPDEPSEGAGYGDASNNNNIQPEIDENLMERMVLDAMASREPHFEYGDASAGPSNTRIPQQPNPWARQYLQLLHDANVPLRSGSNVTVLQHIAGWLQAKVKHGLSQSAFDTFLQLELQAMAPADAEKMPKSFYEVGKYLKPLRLPHIEFHVCVNYCVIFYKCWEDFNRCPFCNEPRYKQNNSSTGSHTVPRKKLWYFPIADRLKRLFLCPKTAEAMTWHANCSEDADEIIHPSGGEAWKHFNKTWPVFASESRNARVGICTDGFTPSQQNSGNVSIWPVFMTVYNLPPEICMTEPYMFISMIISGPKGPGKNLDVMLEPLVEDLDHLWKRGTEAYDAHRKENFTLHVALMWTISDYPGYGMFSCWSTHGRLSCPYCMEKSSAFYLTNGRKISYFDCHRKFLPENHPFRTNKSAFLKGQECHETSFERRNGLEMYWEVEKLPMVQPGSGRTNLPGFGDTHNWVQRSIFWRLEYWFTHLVRHNLDVMHVEKNVFENIFYTLLDDPTKTKDNLKARMDIKKYTTRRDLYPKKDRNGTPLKSKAVYTVTRAEKRQIFEWIKTLHFPDGYAADMGGYFNLQTLKVASMKSHDCHIFLQRLLPVAFADYLPQKVWEPLAELAMFFRKLCSPRILRTEMQVMESKIVETICKLEKIFPPAFFNSMEHLPMHLPYEARVCGPVQYRWMYPFERRMHILKGYVKNASKPEGSIAKAYIDSEITNFCAMYFSEDMEFCINRLARNEVPQQLYSEEVLSVFQNQGKPLGKGRKVTLNNAQVAAAHLYVLLNCSEVEPLLSDFDDQHCRGLNNIQQQRTRAAHFPAWFAQAISAGHYYNASPSLALLVNPPSPHTRSYHGYIVNGFRFHINSHGLRGPANSGICVRGPANQDADPSNYYGILDTILKLEYHGHNIYLFMCSWFNTHDPNDGVWINAQYGLVEVNPTRHLPIYEPFILANQATQVYYTTSAGNEQRQKRRGWLTVISTRARHVIQGFTNDQQSDNENTHPDEPIVEYQDNNTPTIVYAYDATDDHIPLANDDLEYFSDEEDEGPSN